VEEGDDSQTAPGESLTGPNVPGEQEEVSLDEKESEGGSGQQYDAR